MTEPAGLLDISSRRKLADAGELLALLARLHDREPDALLLDGLRQSDVLDWMDTAVRSKEARSALRKFHTALSRVPQILDDQTIDTLAVEFANIYLTHTYRIAPTGSVWLAEDHLERQLPMFAVREWYEHHGLGVQDWRKRSDDHIVNELQFLAHLCEQGTINCATDAANFLDQHVLNWMPEFMQLVAKRSPVAFFASAALFTAAFIEELRGYLEEITGIARPPAVDENEQESTSTVEADPASAFVPGAAEGW